MLFSNILLSNSRSELSCGKSWLIIEMRRKLSTKTNKVSLLSITQPHALVKSIGTIHFERTTSRKLELSLHNHFIVNEDLKVVKRLWNEKTGIMLQTSIMHLITSGDGVINQSGIHSSQVHIFVYLVNIVNFILNCVNCKCMNWVSCVNCTCIN